MSLVAAGLEEAAGVLLADRSKRPCGGCEERFQSSCLRLSDEVLYLGEGFFYGVEVRRVGRSHSWHPFSSMRSLTQLLLCTDRLSISTICPAFRRGARISLI